MEDFNGFVLDDTEYRTRLTRKFAGRTSWAPPDPSRVFAVIPGVIQDVRVKPGQKVRWGEGLLTLEAMKMKNEVRASRDAIVRTVLVRPGQMVRKGELLVELDL